VCYNKVTFFNSGILSADWSAEKMLADRTSDPHNPDIARIFFSLRHDRGLGMRHRKNNHFKVGDEAGLPLD